MDVFLGILIFITLIYYIQQIFYWLLLIVKDVSPSNLETEELPSICVCVAARNEEESIEETLTSLIKLDYPIEKLDIWIADDQSTDKTAALIKDFARKYNHVHYFEVTKQFDRIRGKQNALAHIMRKSDSEMIAIVDADIEVKPTWLKELVKHMSPNTALVCGSTTVKPNSTFNSIIQHYDWIYLSIMLKCHSDFGKPISGIGNNMLCRRSVYEDAGGYESMRFSIIEDYLLYYELCEKRGHEYHHVMTPASTNLARPNSKYTEVIEQRYRWARGSSRIPKDQLLAFALPTIATITVLISFIFSLELGVILLATRCIIDIPLRLTSCSKMQQPSKLWFIPFWHLTTLSTAVLISLCPLRKNKVTWKGRKI